MLKIMDKINKVIMSKCTKIKIKKKNQGKNKKEKGYLSFNHVY